MQLGRSSKSKNRSLNLRQRKINSDTIVKDVITELLTEEMNFEGNKFKFNFIYYLIKI
jgi:hypothetical protein